MKRKYFSRVCYGIATVCGLFAVGCLAEPLITTHMASSYRPRVTRHIISASAKHHAKISYESNNVKPVNLKDEVKARDDSKGYQEQGELLVPSANGLHLPIYSGIGNDMMLGAGTGNNDPMGSRHDSYVLFGHHMRNRDALFSPLYDKATVGTNVYVTNLHDVYVYRINQRKIVSQNDVGLMNDDHQPIIRLITCQETLGGSTRVLLSGKLTKSYPLNKAPKALKSDITRPCNNHQVLKGY